MPVTDVSIVRSKWVDYEPIQSGTNPIEFVIKSLSDYIDINKTELRLVVKVTKRKRDRRWEEIYVDQQRSSFYHQTVHYQDQ